MSACFDRQYKKHGLEKIQHYLLDGLRSELPSGSTVLDIGCGVGALHLTLLQEGASGAIGVEISEGMLEKARRHAMDLGMADKTIYLLGDVVDRESEVRESDVAMLDKVVCCYPDPGALLSTSLRKTKHLLTITHPRNNFLAAVLFKSHIALARLFRLSFYPFWHDWEALHESIVSRGFELLHARSTPVWQARVYKRIHFESPSSVSSQGLDR